MALNENELKEFRNTVSELRDTVDNELSEVREKAESIPADIEQKVDRMTERLADLETKRNRKDKTFEPNESVSEGTKAFTKWLRDQHLSSDEREALTKAQPDVPEKKDLTVGSSGNQSDSLAPAEFVQEIIKDVVDISPFRQVARVRQTNRKEAEFPKLQGRPNAGFVSETGTRTDDTSADFGGEDDLIVIDTHEFYVNLPVTRQMLEDGVFDVEAEAREVVSTEMSRIQGEKFLQGSGTGEPQGLITSGDFSAEVTNDTSTDGVSAISANEMRQLPAFLKQTYRRNGQWGLTREALRHIMTLTNENGQYIWNPQLSGDMPANISGYPYTEMEDLVTAANAGQGDTPVVFGDYQRAYYVVDRLAMEVIRDPYSAKKQGKIEYHFRGRVGGDLVLGEAVTGLEIA